MLELYKNINDLIWDSSILKSMVRHYQRQLKCDRQTALDYVKDNCREFMIKYYEQLYLPQVNLEMEYSR